MNDQTDAFLRVPTQKNLPIYEIDKQELGKIWGKEHARAQAIIKRCPKVELTIGIFFDGTYNNSYNTDLGLEPTTSHTNIWHLYHSYPNGDQELHPCGGLKSAVRALYIRGIGTKDGKANSSLGGGTGHGEWGLESRLEDATRQLNGVIFEYGNMQRVGKITLDLFGFSRGAATARVFANMLADVGDPKVKVRFMGLFDTVGSFGIAGNKTEMSTIDEVATSVCRSIIVSNPAAGYTCLALVDPKVIDMAIRANSAEIVYHITAEDELRYFFPLTRALPSHATEVSMPGAHADVGGGYPYITTTEEYDQKYPSLAARGWFDRPPQEVSRLGNMRFGIMKTIYVRTVVGGLSQAALVAMLAFAKRSGLRMIDPIMERGGDIEEVAQCLIAGRKVEGALARRIRSTYVHRSFGGEFAKVSFKSTREIFDNPR